MNIEKEEVVCKCDPCYEHHDYDPLPGAIAANAIGIAALKNHAITLIEQLERKKKDAEWVAWALSHGWEIHAGRLAPSYWRESVTGICYGCKKWYGKGIPPLTDELRQIIDEQMEVEG